jgi:DNA (cytosine-5)-methyltransferase 1
LFSGIGGFSLGLEEAGLVETVAFCDWEAYCQDVLKKHWPGVPVYGDIKELTHERLRSDGIDSIDIITGGYPCQPFSVAGRQKAEQDPRHLWPEYFRLIKELRPTWVIGENVSGHVKLGLDTVLENLESEGYATRTFSISASSIGANHQRERIWIIANSNNTGDRTSEHEIDKDREKTVEGRKEQSQPKSSRHSEDMENSRRSQWPWSFEQGEDENETEEGDANQFERSGSSSEPDVANTKSVSSYGREHRKYTEEGDRKREVGRESSSEMADSNNERCKEQRRSIAATSEGESLRKKSQRRSSREIADWWSVEPSVGRVAHGLPKRVDRLKCLGNSVVPIIPYLIGKSILEIYE